MINDGINETLESFLRSNTASQLQDSKKSNLSEQNFKNIESNATSNINKLFEVKQYDSNSIETLTLCFKSLYIIQKSYSQTINLIKQHQFFIINLINQKFISESLIELNTLLHAFNKFIHGKRISFGSLSTEIFLGIAFIEIDDYTLIKQIIAWHFFILQASMQFISKNMKLIINNKDSFWNWRTLESISLLFLKSSGFNNWIALAHDEDGQKYHRNCIKMIKGFLNITNTLLKHKTDDDTLKSIKTSFILKSIEYCNDLSMKEELVIESKHIPFINDLADHSCYSELSNKIKPTNTYELSQLLHEFTQSRDSRILSKLHSSLINIPPNAINNQRIIKSILNFKFDTSSSSFAFIDIISSILQSSQLSKKHIPIIDLFVVFIAAYVTTVEFHETFYPILNKLFNILEKLNQEKRLRNLSNILYNMGNKSRDSRYWKAAIDIEFSIIETNHNKENFNQVLIKSQKILNVLFELKSFSYANDIAVTIMLFLEKSDELLSNFPILSQLICKLILNDISLLRDLLRKLSETSRIEISRIALQFLEFLPSSVEAFVVVDTIFELGNFSNDNIGLVAYYCYNIGDKNRTLDIDISSINDLLTSGICLRKLVNYNWEESLLTDSVSKMESWLLDETSITSKLEEEIFTLLIQVLKYNGAIGYIHRLIELYQSRRTLNIDFDSYLQMELCSCLIHVSSKKFPDAVTSYSNFLKSSKISSIRTIIGLNLLQYEYFIKVNNQNSSQERFDKISKVLNDRDEFRLNTNNSFPMVDRYNNLLIISKFQLLTAEFNISKNEYHAAYSNLKTSTKLLYSLIRKSITSLSKDKLNMLKWETINLLFDSLRLMLRVLVHLGISRDLLYYLAEFQKLNEVNCVPLVNAANHLELIVYYYLLMEEEKIKYHVECFRNLREISMVSYDIEISNYSNLIFPLMQTNHEFSNIPPESLMNLTKHQSTSFDIPHLISLGQSNIHTVNEEDRSIPGRILHGKHLITTSLKALTSVIDFANIDTIVKSLPCISSDGFSNSTFSPVETLNKLVYCKDLLFSFLNMIKNMSTYLVRDFQNVLNQCLLLLSSMSVFKLNTTLLIDLYFLQEYANSISYMNDISMDHFSNGVDNLLPAAVESSSTVPDFKSTSMNLNVDMNLLVPHNWTIINIDICNSTGDILMSKFVNGEVPFFLRIPLQRFRDRGEVTQSFEEVKMNFQQIIRDSNSSTKPSFTSSIVTKEEKKKWWQLRFTLDMELQELMEHVEKYWFGGFASVFNHYINDSVFKKFCLDFKNILNKSLPSRKNQLKKYMEFDENLIKLFYETETCDRLKIDDLVYYLLDSLSLHGEINGYGELATIVGTPIRKLLEKYQDVRTKMRNEHIILIPGVSCSFFPWESLSVLRNKSVSRVTNVNMLLKMIRKTPLNMTIENKSKLHYLINPGGDLRRTEELFKHKFESVSNWTGLIGEIPNEDELIKSLQQQEIFVYLGHGGCDHYLKTSSLLKEFSRESIDLPPSLLIGCSSGIIQTNGTLEPCGNILNWLTFGSPMVMVNLWDVTDKDIDLFSNSIFEKWGLFHDQKSVNISRAISQSRDMCTLKYLNGAAPVVYGLPLFIN